MPLRCPSMNTSPQGVMDSEMVASSGFGNGASSGFGDRAARGSGGGEGERTFPASVGRVVSAGVTGGSAGCSCRADCAVRGAGSSLFRPLLIAYGPALPLAGDQNAGAAGSGRRQAGRLARVPGAEPCVSSGCRCLSLPLRDANPPDGYHSNSGCAANSCARRRSAPNSATEA